MSDMPNNMISHFSSLLKDNQKKFSRVATWNSWMEGTGYSISMRISQRCLEGDIREKCFDLSNITIYDSGKGHFTALLEYLEENCHYTLYVENVLEQRFQNFFTKRGYTFPPYRGDGGPPSLYKRTSISMKKVEKDAQRG